MGCGGVDCLVRTLVGGIGEVVVALQCVCCCVILGLVGVGAVKLGTN